MGDGTGDGPRWIRTRAQLLQQESRSTIARRCRSGEYLQVMRGVYADAEPRGVGRCRAVSLWRADATFSHTTAAWLWGLIDEPGQVHITVPRAMSPEAPRWLTIHRYDLPAPHSWVLDLPVVDRARAVVESLPLLERAQAERLVDECSPTDEDHRRLLDVCHEDAGRTGVVRARAIVHRAVRRTASEAERVLARELARRGYRLACNEPVGPWFGDFVDEWSRVIVEVDGRGPHSERSAFRNDRRRQNRLLLDGWLVLRYAAEDVFEDVRAVADEVVATVARRRRSRRHSPYRP